jgi:hypothetical protein
LLEKLRILKETTGKQRDRQLLYGDYVTALTEGPESAHRRSDGHFSGSSDRLAPGGSSRCA